jgi:HSP20 family protein
MATDSKQKNERSHSERAVQRPQQRSPETAHRDRDWEPSSSGPFSIMRQGLDEMERWLGHLGWTRGSGSSPAWGSPSGWGASGRGLMSQMAHRMGDWMPAIDAFQRGNEFVIRAELPGMSRQDLTVEVGDDSVTLHGERKRELEEDREGIFWSERSYGSFTRVIPMPPGAIGESAKATFNNGILEIVMSAPSAESRRGRRIDISGGTHEPDKKG